MKNPLIEIFEEVAGRLDLTTKEVSDVVMDFFLFVKNRMTRVSYRKLDSFKNVKTNISIPGFGKLVIRNRTDKRLQYGKEKRNKSNRENNA